MPVFPKSQVSFLELYDNGVPKARGKYKAGEMPRRLELFPERRNPDAIGIFPGR